MSFPLARDHARIAVRDLEYARPDAAAKARVEALYAELETVAG
jgi:hypothetical protein